MLLVPSTHAREHGRAQLAMHDRVQLELAVRARVDAARVERALDGRVVMIEDRQCVAAGRAQCVLGNHELAILRDDSKHGNRWFLDPDHPEQRGEFATSRPIPAEHKTDVLAFLGELPLALEREDLRVVHAAWHAPSIDHLRAAGLDEGAYEREHARALGPAIGEVTDEDQAAVVGVRAARVVAEDRQQCA